MADRPGPNQERPAPGFAVMQYDCPYCKAEPLQRCKDLTYGILQSRPHLQRSRAMTPPPLGPPV